MFARLLKKLKEPQNVKQTMVCPLNGICFGHPGSKKAKHMKPCHKNYKVTKLHCSYIQ